MTRKSIRLCALVVAAGLGLGCSLTGGLFGRPTNPPPAVVGGLPTRTPWPTFTFTPVATPTPLPTFTRTPTPTGTPTSTSTPTPPVTNTPEATATRKPAPKPKPTAPPAPEATQKPAFQFTPLAWQGQWNGGLGQIRGHIKDAGGNPVKGFFVQARCGGTTLASNPSGTNLYAPSESYEPGAYDIILSSPLDPNSMCKWEVRVVQADNYQAAKDPGAPALSDVGYCDLTWNEMSICFAEWRKNW